MEDSRLHRSVSLSILAHVLLVACWYFAMVYTHSSHPPRRQMTWMEVEPLPKAPVSKKTPNNNSRVVQTKKIQKSKTVAPDAFLGEQNQIVDRETVSRNQKTLVESQAQKQRTSGSPKVAEWALSKFGLPILPKTPESTQVPNIAQERMSSDFARPPELGQDYIKGMKESDGTALNTREYVFYGYFQRIRRQLDRAWETILKEHLGKMYRTGRQLASDMDHETKLVVTLNPTGEIVRVQIVSESGTKDLDEAAVKAFNQAGPFPNPPKGIVDKSGYFEVRWDFILKS